MNLSRKQKAAIFRTLVTLAEGGTHIPFTISEIAAKLTEPLGTSISDMTTREYVRDGGFTWKQHKPIPPTRKDRIDRISELAKIVRQIADDVGIADSTIFARLQALITKQRLDDEAE